MEGFVVDPRKSGPEEFERGLRDVKLVFGINHTMPYTEEYDNLVKELFKGKMSLEWDKLFMRLLETVFPRPTYCQYFAHNC